jgi:hypothetical protein
LNHWLQRYVWASHTAGSSRTNVIGDAATAAIMTGRPPATSARGWSGAANFRFINASNQLG